MTISASRSRVRLVDIANEVGVSRAVVGRVLLGSGANIRVSPDKARQIRQIAKRLKYRPNQIARQLGGKSSQLLGVLIGKGLSQGRMHRLLAVESEARRRGYRIMIGQVSPAAVDVEQYLEEFDAHNVEGVLYLDTRMDVSEQLSAYPMAVSSLRLPGHEIAYVELDRTAAGRMAVEHLLSRGRKRIGMLAMMAKHEMSRAETNKEVGYLAALAEHGHDYGPQLIYRLDADPQCVEQLLPAVEQMVVKDGCDAIIAVRDIVAVYMLKALRRRGIRVPEDVALMGFDNLDLSLAVDPELTSIDHRHEDCACAMLDLLVRMIEDENLPNADEMGIMIPPLLVVRQST
jgi:DNA-binding LacI/PurR family transcriptional regulator